MKEKKSERLQLRLTPETLRRLRVLCGYHDLKMSEMIEILIESKYLDQVSLWGSQDLIAAADDISLRRFSGNESA